MSTATAAPVAPAPVAANPAPAQQPAQVNQAVVATTSASETKETPIPQPFQQKSSLYVGELDPSVNEGQLFDIFNQIGAVHSIRVCRDVVTRRSLGYAYVNYNANMDPTSAQRAIEQLNYQPIAGKPMRIMWSDRDPSQRRSGQGNVFIKNLDPSIDHKALHDTFAQFGKILSCKIATDEHGNTKRYGFVHFETADSAKTAIEKVNGKKLRDNVVYVGPFVKRTERLQQHEKDFTNLYVKNLDEAIDDESMSKLFGKFGEITSCAVMKDHDGKSKKFGFVNFANADGARNAIQELHEQDCGLKSAAGEPVRLYVQRAQKKSERQQLLRQHYDELRQKRYQRFQGLNVYVRNLAEQVDDEELKKEFESFGAITSTKVMRDNQNVSRGFGFVCFSTPEEANKAIQGKQSAMLKGKPLYVTLAQPKEVRRMQSEQFAQRGNMVQGAQPGGPPPMGPSMYNPGMMYNGMQGPGGQVYFPPQQMQRGPNQMSRGRGGRMPANYGMGMPPKGMIPYQQPMPQRMPNQRMPRGGRPYPARNQQRPGQLAPPYQGGNNYYNAGSNSRGGRGDYRGAKSSVRGRGGRMGDGPRPAAPPAVPAGGAGQPMPPMGAAPPTGPMPPVQAPAAEVPRADVLDPKQLASLSPKDQKQLIGEKLFESIEQMVTKRSITGKVTGMLLEMDTNELLVLYENPTYLKQKVNEALYVLKEAGVDADEPDAA